MIFEKNCLFLFNGDIKNNSLLNPINRDIKYINFEHFIDDNIINIDEFQKMIHNSNLIAYIDSENRLIKYLTGPLKYEIEKY